MKMTLGTWKKLVNRNETVKYSNALVENKSAKPCGYQTEGKRCQFFRELLRTEQMYDP